MSKKNIKYEDDYLDINLLDYLRYKRILLAATTSPYVNIYLPSRTEQIKRNRNKASKQ